MYHNQINKGQKNEIEWVQKECLKVINGYQKSYNELLEISQLETMEQLREKVFKNFTEKTLENPKYQPWFLLKSNLRDTRVTRPYIEERATSVRLYKSPVYAMRRLLNDKKPVEDDPEDLTGIHNIP